MVLPADVKMTPMLAQYREWKEKYPDCILFFRMGDFYEMFFDDAKKASEILDITLTARDPSKSIPMAGVPWHSVSGYLGRLVRAGCKVAICEQTSEPDGRTLVDRKVIRIVTPGTYVPEEAGTGGHLVSVTPSGDGFAVALLSVETGRLEAGELSLEETLSLLEAFAPGELLHPKGFSFPGTGSLSADYFLIPRSAEFFSPLSGTKWLCEQWGLSSLSCFGVEDGSPEAGSAAAVLKYLYETQFGAVEYVHRVHPLQSKEYLHLDMATQRNLELFDEGRPSLYGTLNRCRSAMGRRKLREWMLRPLTALEPLRRRQDAVEHLVSNHRERRMLRSLLAECRDVERSSSRLSLGTGGPRDMGAIRDTLRLLPAILPLCGGPLAPWTDGLPDLSGLAGELCSALEEELPRTRAAGDVIRRGYDRELDEWRDTASGASDWLDAYLAKVRSETGLSKIKTGYNKIYGYYLEVSKTALASVPANFVRKQTLVNAERFVTEEIGIFEEKMRSAGDEIARREGTLYDTLVARTLEQVGDIQNLGDILASLDVLASLAEVAAEKRYVRPGLNEGHDLAVLNGRHPVVEDVLTGAAFVPNTLRLVHSGKRVAILTGPNMAGKSTYLRMAALLVLMAQMGGFIPAESAEIGLCDHIFTRIGARDDLAAGNSTFMVEMIETANILHNVTDRSLVILDEVGRGTSTYDGMSIAWAVLEYLADELAVRPKVLFATHYHELSCLEERFPQIENLSMAVKEEKGTVHFLHQVVKGSADRSYGIEVARLAGIPRPVLNRAFDLLQRFESEDRTENFPRRPAKGGEERQLALFDSERHGLVEELASIDPDGLTPFRALELLYKLHEKSREVLRSENIPSS